MRFKVRLHKPRIHMHTVHIRLNTFTLMVMDMSWVRDDSFLFGRAWCGTLWLAMRTGGGKIKSSPYFVSSNLFWLSLVLACFHPSHRPLATHLKIKINRFNNNNNNNVTWNYHYVCAKIFFFKTKFILLFNKDTLIKIDSKDIYNVTKNNLKKKSVFNNNKKSFSNTLQ